MPLAQQQSSCATTSFGSKLFLPVGTTFVCYVSVKGNIFLGERTVTLLKAPVWISVCYFGVCVDLCVSVKVTVVSFSFSTCNKVDRNQLCWWVKDAVVMMIVSWKQL